MTTSLSILLPVYNAENRLEAQVDEILDVLPELTTRFDLLIIDDGSTDDTSEIAASLVRSYPQVRSIRHPIRLGLDEAIQTGLGHTTGEVVFVGDEIHGLDPSDLRKLWHLRQDRKSPAPYPHAPTGKNAWLKRLVGMGDDRQGARAHLTMGMHMIRRDASESGPQQSGGHQAAKQPKHQSGGRRFVWDD